MNNAPKSGKRIVSRSEYARVQAKRAGQGILGAYIVLLSGMCGTVALVSSVYAVGTAVSAMFKPDELALEKVWLWVLFAVVSGAGTLKLMHMGYGRIHKAAENDVAPLTRANTADLPAPTSLVRASQEPTQAQEGILLRAAMEGQEKREEQLLRASAGEYE